MSGNDWAEAVGAAGITLMLTTVLTVTIWQLFATWRAKATLSREKEFEALANRAVEAEERSNAAVAEISAQLTELRTRMSRLEEVLTQVE